MFSTLISVNELSEHLQDPDWVILDCRFSLKDTEKGRTAYAESHIPRAQYVHLDEDLSGDIIPGETGRHPLPDIDQFAQHLGRWGITNTTQVIAYDDLGGPIAARLWWMMHWLGHTRVAVLDGGWPEWVRNGLPTERHALPPSQATFIPDVQPHKLVEVAALQHALHSDKTTLIDARAAERYAGLHEPIDPIAGHIPGALSYPFKENLDKTGLFKPIDALKARFQDLTQTKNQLICYCGSGVTAAHNLLAMTHAGIHDAQLYAGSWSEWIIDPNRPTTTSQGE